MNFRKIAIASLILALQSPAFAGGFLENDYAYMQKGKIAYQAGLYDQAIRPLTDAIQANPNSAEAHYWRALCFIGLNQSGQALDDLNEAVRLNNTAPAFYLSRGMLYSNDKKFDQAISDFDAALRLDPYLQEAKTNKAYCAQQLAKPVAIATLPAEAAKPVKTVVAATASMNKTASAQAANRSDSNKKTSTTSSDKEESRAIAEMNARLENERQERLRTERELAEFKKEQEKQLAELKKQEKQDKQKEKLAEGSKKHSKAADDAPPPEQIEHKVSVETKVAQNVDSAQAKQMAVDAVAEQSASRPVKDKWAVIVGISKFENSDLNLHYPAKDAQDFYNYLVTKGNFAKDHVKLLINETATRQNILTLVGDKWLPFVANPDDLVVIYISSHGSSSEMDKEGTNYLLAYDSEADALFSSGLAMQDLTRTIKARVHSDRVVMILDACHSGAVSAEAKGLERGGNVNAAAIAQGTGQLVISSSAPDQVSWESKKDANSVFTKYLMEGLAQKGDKTTLEDAFQFMKDKVQQEVLSERGVLQTPVLRSVWKGSDLVLNAKPASPREAMEFHLGTPVETKSVSGTVLQKSTVASTKSLSPATKSTSKAKP